MRKILTIISTVVLFFMVSAGAAEASDVLYYGHRGLTNSYPENTLVSFQGAMNAGFDGIEFDVFQTQSKDLMVFHDTQLYRMCKKGGTIYKVSEKNRKSYPIRSGHNISKYKNNPLYIPTFEETVAYMASVNGGMYINLKGCGRYTTEGINKMTAILRKYHMEDKSVIFCSSISLLNRFKNRGLKVGYLEVLSNRRSINTHLKACAKYKINVFVMFMPEWLTKSDVNYCHRNHIQVGSYKVRTKNEAKRLVKMNVDFMFNYGKLLK